MDHNHYQEKPFMDPILFINEEGVFNPEAQAQHANPCLLDVPGTFREIHQDTVRSSVRGSPAFDYPDAYPPEFDKAYPPLHACPRDMVRTFTMVVGVVASNSGGTNDSEPHESWCRRCDLGHQSFGVCLFEHHLKLDLSDNHVVSDEQVATCVMAVIE